MLSPVCLKEEERCYEEVPLEEVMRVPVVARTPHPTLLSSVISLTALHDYGGTCFNIQTQKACIERTTDQTVETLIRFLIFIMIPVCVCGGEANATSFIVNETISL